MLFPNRRLTEGTGSRGGGTYLSRGLWRRRRRGLELALRVLGRGLVWPWQRALRPGNGGSEEGRGGEGRGRHGAGMRRAGEEGEDEEADDEE